MSAIEKRDLKKHLSLQQPANRILRLEVGVSVVV